MSYKEDKMELKSYLHLSSGGKAIHLLMHDEDLMIDYNILEKMLLSIPDISYASEDTP